MFPTCGPNTHKIVYSTLKQIKMSTVSDWLKAITIA